MPYILVIGSLVVIFYFIAKGTTAKPSFDTETRKDGTIKISNPKNIYEELANRFGESIDKIISDNNFIVTLSMVLGTIKNESSSLFKTKTNAQVMGDNGNSYGYMQVSKPALSDVNYRYATLYQLSDLKDESTNLFCGIAYLNICYESAKSSGAKNPVQLAYKKYNGGNDETTNSLNVMASGYAVKAYANFNEFEKIFA